MTNYYQILGVPFDATSDEIEQRYRQLKPASKPNNNRGDEPPTPLETAYKTLTHAYDRWKYDQLLKEQAKASGLKGEDSRFPTIGGRKEYLFHKVMTELEKTQNIYPSDRELLKVVPNYANNFRETDKGDAQKQS